MAAASRTVAITHPAAYTSREGPITPAVSTRVMVAIMVGIATTAFMAQGQSAKPADLAAVASHVTVARPVIFNICPRSTAISVSRIHRLCITRGKDQLQYR
jgi:hypothetical protein